jgi:DeoR/GlpR family transcriptional regulator of sugar metabolism
VLAAERRRAIVRLVQEQGAVDVSGLSRRFRTSQSTIRRDLERLDSHGELRRTHGGAVAVDQGLVQVQPFDQVAQRIGSAAAKLIRPGETVFVGPGRLCHSAARALSARSDLTVITNALEIAWLLFQTAETPLVLTGGPLIRPGGVLTGQVVLRTMETMRADRLIVEVTGVDPLEGLTSDQFTLAETMRPILDTVNHVIVLVASDRLGRVGAAWLGDVSDADVIITGRDAPTSIAWDLSETGTEVKLV